MNENILIDLEKLEERVQRILGEINLNHLSYVEVVKLLCDHIEEGKPSWMKE